MNLGEILEAVKEVILLEKKIEVAIKREQNAKRRKKLHKAIKKVRKSGKDSDLTALRELLFKL